MIFKQKTHLLFNLLFLSIFTFVMLSSFCFADTNNLNIPEGQVLYTKFSFFHEKLTYRTTNYRKGILVPVNTKVTFVKADKSNIIVTLPNGENLRIVNIKNFSGEEINGIFERTFSTKPVNLSGFTSAERNAIMAGEVKVGMRKSAVIVALGYPPKHQTPNLELDQWRYWQNRFNTFIVHFKNNRVVEIQN
jgi:hypothetical protein